MIFALLATSYLVQGVFGDAEFPFVANSVAKDGLFAMLAMAAFGDVRRNAWAVVAIILGHLLLIGSLLVMLAFGGVGAISGSFDAPPGLGLPDPKTLLYVWLGLATVVVALLSWLRARAGRARYRLRYLAPHQHRTVMAMAEILVLGDDEVLTAEQVAANIDGYLYSLRARAKRKSKLALTALTIYPLVRFRPPLPLLSPQRRLSFVERAFINDVSERRLPGFLRRLVQSMLFAAQQLTFIGYYSDPRTHESTGYVPFSERPRYSAALASVDTDRQPLDVRTPREIDAEAVTADVAIVGSGAAGAILAHRLAGRGRDVLLLERGLHVDPADFTEDERRQFSDLYADGGLQLSTDARFQVLQGMCVGGTTVVNNAVCFDLPADVLDRWNDGDGLDAGLDPARLDASFSRIREWLPVTSQAGLSHLGAGGSKLEQGIRQLGLDRAPGEFEVVEANLADCFGCGYCNIGCRFGKKLSALDTTLPRAQREFGVDSVRIFSECEVERIRGRNGTNCALDCRLSDGRRLRVSANTVVLSAGALASSLILQRSGLGGGQTGRGLSFNLGAPMTAEFAERIDAYDGLQISHYLRPPGDEGLVIESWFNPVGAQSLFMPGWFDDHFQNMRRYAHMASAGSVVGTRGNGRISSGFGGRRIKLDYRPHPDDLARLTAGLEMIGAAFLEAGALRVMPPTFRYLPISDRAGLHAIGDTVRDNTDITLHSSHPQGGNAISRDPKKGVVDEGFAVRGTAGVYVCDASVFPAAITVNPQLTVMALADYAAAGID